MKTLQNFDINETKSFDLTKHQLGKLVLLGSKSLQCVTSQALLVCYYYALCEPYLEPLTSNATSASPSKVRAGVGVR